MKTPTNLCKFEIHEFKCTLKKVFVYLFTYGLCNYGDQKNCILTNINESTVPLKSVSY